jgi:intein-encoded DNA endonuclease-like protein
MVQAMALQGVLQKLQISETLVEGGREGGREGVRTLNIKQFGGDDLLTKHNHYNENNHKGLGNHNEAFFLFI